MQRNNKPLANAKSARLGKNVGINYRDYGAPPTPRLGLSGLTGPGFCLSAQLGSSSRLGPRRVRLWWLARREASYFASGHLLYHQETIGTLARSGGDIVLGWNPSRLGKE